MRLALAIAVLAASAVSAHAAEDRYGAPRPGATVGATASVTVQPYAGPTLSWSGKTAMPTTQTAQPAAQTRPAMMPDGLYRPAPAPAPPPMAAASPYAPPPAPYAAAAAYAPAPAPTAYRPAAAPTSLYSRSGPQAAVDTLPPPPSPTTVQGGIYASTGARYYSVHRPYGQQPDPIPAVPAGERMAYRPEASLAGEVALSGVGDGVRTPDSAADDSMAGVGAADEQEEAERAAKRDAERLAARRAAAASSGK